MASGIISKVKDSLLNDGVFRTALKVINYPASWLKQRNWERKRQRFAETVNSTESREERFTWIYKNNYWGSQESASGDGSTLEYTENLRKELPGLLQRFSIQSIFDAPCGDFNWMRHLLPNVDVEYIGGDIVRPLVDDLNSRYRTGRISFIHFDLIKDTPPKVDLVICRDCLFHLSFVDTRAALQNFLNSGALFLLTTTHTNTEGAFVNEDISTGDFRRIDLFSPPYNFPRDPLASIDDWISPFPERQMSLWSRDQVAMALASNN
jgi:SAM-dependent methyltransferase